MERIGSYRDIEIFKARNVVLGTGAAGLNAADKLHSLGVKDLLIVTEGILLGTSRNTGSDKQTYYKLSLAGDDNDSVRHLAKDLFAGRAVDGDIALCEASLSAPGFLHLVELGVPFPKNRYGEYIGYKTDHDPHRRATSAGPYTSKFMTEALERSVRAKNIEILDGYQAVKIISDGKRAKGLVLLKRSTGKLSVLLSDSLVMATGGPAGIYSLSVYPLSQYGATGLAFEAGAKGRNLTEWQYGMASVKPRWNVSGSYMQVLPRVVSVDSEGREYDFLSSYPRARGEMLSLLFLKGYQWPFDVRKLEKGSSIVDMLVYLELEKGRRVYLDYMHNPDNQDIDYSELSEEARDYLERSGATGPTPIERLRRMNEPAYQFYLDKGVDLEKEMLEIAISAQHNNGGIAINCWWETSVEGLFAIGEAAASHGVYRPGGSALNSGQVGSARAAEYIAAKRNEGEWIPSISDAEAAIDSVLAIKPKKDGRDLRAAYEELRMRMSINASVIREKSALKETLRYVEDSIEGFSEIALGTSPLWIYYQYWNALITSKLYLVAMLEYIEDSGLSRGSALYSDPNGNIHPDALDERFTYNLETSEDVALIRELVLDNGEVICSKREPNPIPEDDDFFENVWAIFREKGSVY